MLIPRVQNSEENRISKILDAVDPIKPSAVDELKLARRRISIEGAPSAAMRGIALLFA
ncbi:MAG: hypothetical protein OXN84_03320 [Albidovulum sp.]|nr:hypothetical protein [Albidovulum sp.]